MKAGKVRRDIQYAEPQVEAASGGSADVEWRMLEGPVREEERNLGEPLDGKPEEDVSASVAAPAPADASATASATMLSELRTLQKEVDRILLVLLLFSTILVHYMALPKAARPVTSVVGLGAAAGTMSMWWLEVLDHQAALLALINVFVIIPYNIGCFVMFYLTWPLRMVLYQVLQFICIPLFSKFTVFKSFSDADYAALLSVMPIAYDMIMFGEPERTWHNIDEVTAEEAFKALSTAPFFKMLNAATSKRMSASLISSISFRIVMVMGLIPTIGWWWVGWCSMPLLPLHPAHIQSKVQQRAHNDNEASEETPSRQQETNCKDLVPPQQTPPTQLYIPKCKWLMVSREKFGERIGKAKCINE